MIKPFQVASKSTTIFVATFRKHVFIFFLFLKPLYEHTKCDVSNIEKYFALYFT